MRATDHRCSKCKRWLNEDRGCDACDSNGSLERVVRVLRLNLKGCYFDAIKAGTKAHEFRLAATWEKRLLGKVYDEIHLLRGYPKTGDESRILRRRWNGYRVVTITHPHFGPDPVLVLAIDVTKHPNVPDQATASDTHG